jgi:hypothetical protein
MAVSYQKNKVHILKWREENKDQYKAYRKAYSSNSVVDKTYQAQYRMYKRECNRLMNIEI